jgi:L,D-transpeptidase YcbB
MFVRGSSFLSIGALALIVTTGGVFAEEPVATQAAVEIVEEGEATAPELVLDETSAAIRDLIADAGNHGGFLDKRDAAAVAEFYAERNYLAAWLKDGVLSEEVQALIARIGNAEIDGLDSSAYRLPTKGLINYAASMPEYTAQAEIMLSQAIVAYAREAYSGRIDPSKLSKDIGYKRRLPDLIEVLTTIAAADAPVETMVAYNPPHPEFAALRDKLAELRGAGEPDKPIEMPEGKALKLGVENARVGFLRKRLELPTDVESPALFDEEVAEAVKAFQRSSRLAVDGVVGPRTIAALNADPVDPIPTILVNMEKWRWMDRDLGQFYVRVNVPDFTVNVYQDGGVIHETRIVVGKVKNKTPIFSDQIEHIIVNPAWYVPASIIKNEMLPEVQANPNALSAYEVFALSKGEFRQVNPRSVNWRTVDPRKIQVRQPPGAGNALGRVKFMFPNEYAVYLHDTPSKSLFKRDYRAFSHGCMRVMNPMEFADALLTQETDRDSDYLERLYGGGEKRVNLSSKIPVHVTYFTAWVDELGKLQTRNDLYGHDRRIAKGVGTS